MNIVTLNAVLVAKEAVRYTPAGIEVFDGVFHHRSEVTHAGVPRKVEFDFPAVTYGDMAGELNAAELGSEMTLKGYLAPRSSKSQRLIVHITEYISRS